MTEDLSSKGETRFTPGPWEFSEEELRGGRYYVVNIPDTADSIDLHENDNGEANARLIAAAPALYEALAIMVTIAERLGPQWRAKLADDESPLGKARSALSLARGQTPGASNG